MKALISLILIFCMACQPSAVEKAETKKSTAKTEKVTKEKDKMGYNKLTKEEEYVIVHKGTERAFTGALTDNYEKGIYVCRRCDTPLYRSDSKFKSNCGWPSFDDEIQGAVKRLLTQTDAVSKSSVTNAMVTWATSFMVKVSLQKNTRHCVNSISMTFIPEKNLERAIFASGCFWGTEYHLEKVEGVLSATSGYIGGSVQNPTYKQICTGTTGHAEAVEVLYDPTKTNYEALAKLYF